MRQSTIAPHPSQPVIRQNTLRANVLRRFPAHCAHELLSSSNRRFYASKILPAYADTCRQKATHFGDSLAFLSIL
jgi:hypothetical protein